MSRNGIGGVSQTCRFAVKNAKPQKIITPYCTGGELKGYVIARNQEYTCGKDGQDFVLAGIDYGGYPGKIVWTVEGSDDIIINPSDNLWNGTTLTVGSNATGFILHATYLRYKDWNNHEVIYSVSAEKYISIISDKYISTIPNKLKVEKSYDLAIDVVINNYNADDQVIRVMNGQNGNRIYWNGTIINNSYDFSVENDNKLIIKRLPVKIEDQKGSITAQLESMEIAVKSFITEDQRYVELNNITIEQ